MNSLLRGLGLASLAFLLFATPALAQTDIHPDQPMPPTSPPPGVTPAPNPAPPAAAPPRMMVRHAQRYSRYRNHWYIGFGIGGGLGAVSSNGDASERQGGVSINFKVGGMITPNFLLGFEASAWRYQRDKAAVQFNHYDVVATLFPFYDGGFFIKGGVGLGLAVLDLGGVLYNSTEPGFDLKLGLGYEWQLLTSFNLGADLSYGMTKYDGGATHDVGLHLSFMWY